MLFSAWLSTAVCQQKAHRDSLIKAARADAKSFRLDDAVWKKYQRKLAYTSDYFKPHDTDVKNAAMLSDSVFVNAYRHEAFKRNKHRRTAGHYVLVGAGAAAGLFVAGMIAILIAIGPNMN